MKQSGLCAMKDSGFQFRTTDTYSMIEDQLRILFPKLFTWISDSEPEDTTTSSWLICMKPPYSRKSLIVYSDDQSLPTGFDIFNACQISTRKVGLPLRVLYLGMPFPFAVIFLLSSCPICSNKSFCSSSSSEKLASKCLVKKRLHVHFKGTWVRRRELRRSDFHLA